MANHKSAKKRAKQNIKRQAANKSQKSRTRSVIKAVREALASESMEKVSELLPKAQGELRKMAKKGLIKLNTAGRTSSRLFHQFNSLKNK